MDGFMNDFQDLNMDPDDYDLVENDEKRPTCKGCLR